MQPEVTVLIPNYKTPIITKLCLRLLRKYTDKHLIKVIVIDNASADDSLRYLQSLDWISLIERPKAMDDTPAASHARALDLALSQVSTPYVLSIHTDTFVKHPDWLQRLLREIKQKSSVAGVGSWKLESKFWFKRCAKAIEYVGQTVYYRLINKTDHALVGQANNYYYLRSHLALYRMDLIRQHGLTFFDGHEPAGKVMYKKLVDLGYNMTFLSSKQLRPYVEHLNHATMVLNPELGGRKKTVVRGHRRIKRIMNAMQAHEVLADDNLDY